jgi:hypothetical protein
LSLENVINITESLCSTKNVYQTFTLFDYLHGRCLLFAFALYQETNFDILFRRDKTNGILLHAYCKVSKNNPLETKYVDARGGVTLQVIRRSYQGNEIETNKATPEQIMDFSNGVGKFNKEEILTLREYIRANKRVYGLI